VSERRPVRRWPASLISLLLGLLLWPRPAEAQGDLATLLSQQAPVVVDGEAAWTALPLPARVLEQSRPDLSDLRLFDARGREVPFVVLGAGGEPFAVPLDRLSWSLDEGRSHLILRRPSGLDVRRLVLHTTTVAFDRRLEVRDVGPGGGGRVVGAARVHREPITDPDDGDVRLTVAITTPRGDALEIIVSDGDSPPLDNLVVVAEVERPILMSNLVGAGTLRFSGGRLRPPRYDVPVGAAREALDHSQADDLRWATLRAASDNPGFDPLPALAFAMKPGATVDLTAFRHRRPLSVGAAREGLSVLALSVVDRAHARPDLGDLRVVDDRGRQLPYLVEPTGRRLRAPLTLEGTAREGSRSRHRFGLPGPEVPLGGIELVLGSTFADRPYRLVAGEGDQAITLAAGYLRRRPGDDAAITIELGELEPVAALSLEIEDGDDAPLSLVAATALVPEVELFVAAPEGRYWLMSGADMAPPRYELERARGMLLSLPRAELVVGTLEDNPAYAPADDGRPPLLLWAVLCLAVAVLGWLTLRAVADDDDPFEHRGDDEPDRRPTAARPSH